MQKRNRIRGSVTSKIIDRNAVSSGIDEYRFVSQMNCEKQEERSVSWFGKVTKGNKVIHERASPLSLVFVMSNIVNERWLFTERLDPATLLIGLVQLI